MKIAIAFGWLAAAAEQSGAPPMSVVREMKSYGAEGIEFDLSELRSPGSAAEFLRVTGLEPTAVTATYDFSLGFEPCRRTAERHFRTALALGAPLVLCRVARCGGNESERAAVPKAFEEWTRLAVKNTLVPMLTDERPDDGFCSLAGSAGVDEYLAMSPQLRLDFDPVNFALAGENALALVEKYAPVTVNFRVGDLRFAGGECAACAAGDGDLDLSEIVRRFVRTGYEGPFAIGGPVGTDAARTLRRSAAFLRETLREQK